MQLDVYFFLVIATAIGWNKSRDLLQLLLPKTKEHLTARLCTLSAWCIDSAFASLEYLGLSTLIHSPGVHKVYRKMVLTIQIGFGLMQYRKDFPVFSLDGEGKDFLHHPNKNRWRVCTSGLGAAQYFPGVLI